MRPLDLPSTRDVPEQLPGGVVWWTRHTRLGVEHVLELPETDDGHALELLLVATEGGGTTWCWRDEHGTVLGAVAAEMT